MIELRESVIIIDFEIFCFRAFKIAHSSPVGTPFSLEILDWIGKLGVIIEALNPLEVFEVSVHNCVLYSRIQETERD